MAHTQPQGFLAAPPTGKGSGVFVLHAWWGLNDTMKALCTRLAESRFVAFAPGLYHGKVADSTADAETLGKALHTNQRQAKTEIEAATVFLSDRVGQADRGLAVIGFSLVAYYALDLAAADPEHIRSVVVFYGTGGGDWSNSRADYLGHFAENDEFGPQSNVDNLEESLRRAGRPVASYRYTFGRHGTPHEGDPVIVAADFIRRLEALVLGGVGPGLPRREQDRHILLKAAWLSLGTELPCSERDLGVALRNRLACWGLGLTSMPSRSAELSWTLDISSETRRAGVINAPTPTHPPSRSTLTR